MVPCHDVAPTCAHVIRALKQYVGRVIAVDDGSRDDTAKALASTRVRVIKHEKNRGKGHAIISGFTEALANMKVEAIVTVDADMQHDPDDVVDLVRRMPCDLVVGNRFARPARNQPLPHFLSNTAVNALLSLKTKRRIHDSQCGFRVYSRALADHLVNTSGGGRFEWETKALLTAMRNGFSVSFIPISMHHTEENHTPSFSTVWDTLRIAATLISA